MTLLDRIHHWKSEGLLSPEQHGLLSTVVSRRQFSVHFELNWFLFAGVLFIITGVSRTIAQYFDRIGDVAILAVLTLLFVSSLTFVVRQAPPFAPALVESPHFAFDYVLYFACLVYSVELGYLETRFGWFGSSWNYHLLVSAILFFVAAYRFDNRLVLSLGVTALAGFFGVELSRRVLNLNAALQASAIVYAVSLIGLGWWLNRRGLKPHFFSTYQHVSILVAFAAVLSGISDDPWSLSFMALLIVLVGLSALHGLRSQLLSFIAYAVVGGYIGVSIVLTDVVPSVEYFVVSGIALLAFLIWLASRWRQTA